MDTQNKSIKFQASERIIEKGAEANKAYMITSGKVSVYLEEDGKKVELATLEQGAIFGETAIFNDGTYGANVEATEDTELFIITPDSLNDMLQGCDPAVRALLRMLIERLKNTNEALMKSETREFMDLAFV